MTPTEPKPERQTIIVSDTREGLDQLIPEMARLNIDVQVQSTAPMPFTPTPLGLNSKLQASAARMKQFARQLPTRKELDENREQAKRNRQALTLKDRKKLLAQKRQAARRIQKTTGPYTNIQQVDESVDFGIPSE